jgi:hypothetical protein
MEPEIHCPIHKGPLPIPTQGQMNAFHTPHIDISTFELVSFLRISN